MIACAMPLSYQSRSALAMFPLAKSVPNGLQQIPSSMTLDHLPP